MRIDTLEPLLRRFGETLGETLTNHLRGPVQIEFGSLGPMKYSDFMGSRAAHTC